ncbi:Nif3-like dinuclear metal center hexameric protein [Mucilaginibacter mallensis]|nr:Nif3-like dinuclear metal center hexameric protein [Mucilaginibacter mallensis]
MKQGHTRRKFITNLSLTTAAVIATPTLSRAGNFFKTDNSYTVGQIMDMFIKTVPGAPFPNTVDTLKAGNRDIVVTSIVTTMFPTVDVIRKTIDLGANFIVCHEPTFYNHTDDVSWLQNDEVYNYKADLLKKHNIAIWRNHDYIHSIKPDGVLTGVIAKLGWKDYQQGANTFIFPGITLGALIDQLKQKLATPAVRYIGDLQQTCKTVIFAEGAAGGRTQIEAISKYKPDVLICGEISEWETAEYVRDARAEGRSIALVVTGHIPSEEAGSAFMADWLKQRISNVKITHIVCGNSLSFA